MRREPIRLLPPPAEGELTGAFASSKAAKRCDQPPFVGDVSQASPVPIVMLRLLFKTLGLLLLAGAFAALVVDGTRSVAAGAAAILPLGRTISALFPNAFLEAHALIEQHVPALWDPVAVTILLLPAWLVFGVLGLTLLALTRRASPKIGYSRR